MAKSRIYSYDNSIPFGYSHKKGETRKNREKKNEFYEQVIWVLREKKRKQTWAVTNKFFIVAEMVRAFFWLCPKMYALCHSATHFPFSSVRIRSKDNNLNPIQLAK